MGTFNTERGFGEPVLQRGEEEGEEGDGGIESWEAEASELRRDDDLRCPLAPVPGGARGHDAAAARRSLPHATEDAGRAAGGSGLRSHDCHCHCLAQPSKDLLICIASIVPRRSTSRCICARR
jgi:hypothetical protein